MAHFPQGSTALGSCSPGTPGTERFGRLQENRGEAPSYRKNILCPERLSRCLWVWVRQPGSMPECVSACKFSGVSLGGSG
jgi:hypothetical protein